VRVVGSVAENEAVSQEFLLDGADGSLDARIIRGEEPERGNQQSRRVERLTVVRLREGVLPPVETVVADVAMNVRSKRAQTRKSAARSVVRTREFLDRLDRAIGRDPRHH